MLIGAASLQFGVCIVLYVACMTVELGLWLVEVTAKGFMCSEDKVLLISAFSLTPLCCLCAEQWSVLCSQRVCNRRCHCRGGQAWPQVPAHPRSGADGHC